MTVISPSLFRHTATVERNTPSVAGSGNVTESWATVATGVAGLLQARKDAYRRSNEGQVRIGAWVYYADAAEDIALGDRFTISSTRYEVVDIVDAGGQSDHWEVGLDLYQGA